MKMSTGKRVLLAAFWLVSVIMIAAAIYPSIGSGIFQLIAALTNGAVAMILYYAFATVCLLLCAAVAAVLFRGGIRRDERGFITIDSSENGRVRISISAAEHMVKQAVYNVDGIQDLKVTVIGEEDAISVDTSITMVSGSHVPTVTMNMQRAIRQFVEVNCGVAVRAVSVSILEVTGAAELNKRSKRGEVRSAAPCVAPESEDAYVDAVPEAAYSDDAAQVSEVETEQTAEEAAGAEPVIESVVEYEESAETEMIEEEALLSEPDEAVEFVMTQTDGEDACPEDEAADSDDVDESDGTAEDQNPSDFDEEFEPVPVAEDEDDGEDERKVEYTV